MSTLSRREFFLGFLNKGTRGLFDGQPGDGDPGITEWREWLKDSLSRFPDYGYGSDDDWLGQASVVVDLSSLKFGDHTLRNLLEHVAERRYEECVQGKIVDGNHKFDEAVELLEAIIGIQSKGTAVDDLRVKGFEVEGVYVFSNDKGEGLRVLLRKGDSYRELIVNKKAHLPGSGGGTVLSDISRERVESIKSGFALDQKQWNEAIYKIQVGLTRSTADKGPAVGVSAKNMARNYLHGMRDGIKPRLDRVCREGPKPTPPPAALGDVGLSPVDREDDSWAGLPAVALGVGVVVVGGLVVLRMRGARRVGVA